MSETPTLQQSDNVAWGRVSYCSCLRTSATAHIEGALRNAKLTVNVQELSPTEGWVYFAVTFDAEATTRDQVEVAIVAGGGQVVEGPP